MYTILDVDIQDKKIAWNTYISHPLQSKAWAESRNRLGILNKTVGIFLDGACVSVACILLYKIPHTKFYRAEILRGLLYNENIYKEFVTYGKKNNIAFFSFEPNNSTLDFHVLPSILISNTHSAVSSWTPRIDTTQPYQEIEKNFSKVVRNESKYALKNNCTVSCGVDNVLFSDFLVLINQTQDRKKFTGYSHIYYKAVFETLKKENEVCVFVVYNKDSQPIAASMVFIFNDTVYYAYAGSLGNKTPKGAMYLLVIEIIKYAQIHNKKIFDLFGSLNPKYSSNHSWKGFSQFKKSFGPTYHEYIGRYDLPVYTFVYRVYTISSTLKRQLTFVLKKLS